MMRRRTDARQSRSSGSNNMNSGSDCVRIQTLWSNAITKNILLGFTEEAVQEEEMVDMARLG
jgi:hypothetical protein